MKILVIGQFNQIPKDEIGLVAHSANELAQAGLPVPYSIVLTKSVFEEFLVDSGAVEQFFPLIKKEKYEKAASLVSSRSFPKELEEQILSELKKHNIKEFDVHCSTIEQSIEYSCYKQRMSDVASTLKACWAASIKQGEPLSSVMLTKHVKTKKYGELYSHHPLNNSRVHCVITLTKPRKGVFYVNKQNGKVANAKDFHNLNSPLLVREKDLLVVLAQQIDSFTSKKIVAKWAVGDGAYVLSYKLMDKVDQDYFFNQATSS